MLKGNLKSTQNKFLHRSSSGYKIIDISRDDCRKIELVNISDDEFLLMNELEKMYVLEYGVITQAALYLNKIALEELKFICLEKMVNLEKFKTLDAKRIATYQNSIEYMLNTGIVNGETLDLLLQRNSILFKFV